MQKDGLRYSKPRGNKFESNKQGRFPSAFATVMQECEYEVKESIEGGWHFCVQKIWKPR